MKKILFTVLLLTMFLSLTALLLGGCKDKETSDNNSIEVEFDYALSSYDVSIEIYDSYTFEIVNKTIETSSVPLWSAEDEKIVKVDQNGKIVALGVGSTKVYVTVAGIVKSANVSVYNSFNAPVMVLNVADDITIGKDDEISVNAKVVYKGIDSQIPLEFSYSVNDDAVLSLEQNGPTCLVKAEAYGETTVQVVCYGYDTPIVKNINVKIVNDSIGFEVENLSPVAGKYIVDLSIVNDGIGTTEFEPEIIVYSDNIKVNNVALEWNVKDDSIAKVENGKIISLDPGETEIDVVYETVKLSFKVKVNLPVAETFFDYVDVKLAPAEFETRNVVENFVIDLPDEEGGELVWSSLPKEDVSFTDETLTISATALEYGENNRFSALFKNNGEYNSVGFKIFKYTAILKTREDVNALGALSKAADERENYYGGYFVLGADIDFAGTAVNTVARFDATNNDGGFVGILDGRGHIINNMSYELWGYGFIGGIQSGSVIKNISFTNVIHPGYTALLGIRARNVDISNVYIHYKKVIYFADEKDVTGMMLGLWSGGSIRNVVIDLSDVDVDFTGKKNAYVFGYNNRPQLLTDCYVIGSDSIKLFYNAEVAYDTGRYSDWNTFATADNDLSGFGADLWDKTDEKLRFNKADLFLTTWLLTDVNDVAQVTNTHDYEKGISPRQKVNLEKGMITKNHRVYLGCGCHTHDVRYSELNLSKEQLIELQDKGFKKIIVGFADETNISSDMTITANFGSRKSVTIPANHGWSYNTYILEIPIEEVIDNYDTISTAWYAIFNVTNSEEVNLGISDMVVSL